MCISSYHHIPGGFFFQDEVAGSYAVFSDGAVRFIPVGLPSETLKGLFTGDEKASACLRRISPAANPLGELHRAGRAHHFLRGAAVSTAGQTPAGGGRWDGRGRMSLFSRPVPPAVTRFAGARRPWGARVSLFSASVPPAANQGRHRACAAYNARFNPRGHIENAPHDEEYPLGESNPCRRTENPMSWATRRRGQVCWRRPYGPEQHHFSIPTAAVCQPFPASERSTTDRAFAPSPRSRDNAAAPPRDCGKRWPAARADLA